MFFRRFHFLVVLAGLTAFGCGNSSTSTDEKKGDGPACSTDATCARGTVCMAGACGTTECKELADCELGQICIADPNGSGSSVCTAVECAKTTDCSNGATCENGICVGGSVIGGACSVTSPCPDGQTCGTDGKCSPGTPGAGAVCDSCATDTDCASGSACVQVGATKHCAIKCTVNGDCDSGYACASFGAVKACAPGKYECIGCLTGAECPADQHCNANTGECSADKEQCGPCQTDGDCGSGYRCYGKSAAKFCIPDCPDGNCPANGSCNDLGDGVKACVWGSDGPCCLGDGCTESACDACAGATPLCKDNTTCVECLANTDCKNASKPTCGLNNTCEATSTGEQCTTDPKKPHFNAATGACCECLNTSHCGGKACDPSTCACKTTGGGGGVCETCVAPYPGCATYNGQQVCVQCTEASQCPSGSCNTATYTCEGTVVPTSGDCKVAGKECVDPLVCDAKSGLCYDANGNCDDVTQFCPNGGKCMSFLDQLPGGGGGGIPLPDLGAGGTLPGGCECQPGMLPGFDQGNCPSGLICGQGIFGILALFDPSIKVPYTCAKSQFGP